jgi:hypothetical protein
MINTLHLLRDTSLVGVAMALVGAVFGEGVGVAVGGMVAVLNLGLHLRASQGMTTGNYIGRLLVRQVLGAALLVGAVKLFPVIPVLAGFTAPIVAVAVRAVIMVFRPTSLAAERG